MMFGSAHTGFLDSTTTYYLTNNLVVIVLAVIFCSPKPGALIDRLSVSTKERAAVSVAGYVFLFEVCIAAMVSNTYASFLYFRF